MWSAGVALPAQQPVHRDVEGVGQGAQLKVGDGTLLPLQKGEGGGADVDTGGLELGQQLDLLHPQPQPGLGHPLSHQVAVTQLQFSRSHIHPPFFTFSI